MLTSKVKERKRSPGRQRGRAWCGNQGTNVKDRGVVNGVNYYKESKEDQDEKISTGLIDKELHTTLKGSFQGVAAKCFRGRPTWRWD